MAGITKTPEGVQALKNLSSSLRESINKNKSSVSSLESVFNQNRGGLAHENEIQSLIEDIKSTNDNVNGAVFLLSNRMDLVANKLSSVIEGGLGGGK